MRFSFWHQIAKILFLDIKSLNTNVSQIRIQHLQID